MKRSFYILIIVALCVLPFHAQKPRDSEKLGMALEYFTAAKYHEALLLFEQLDKQYELNPRFHAYMGVCYYHEWQYEKACQYLESAIPQLHLFNPHERSVYYYTAGESHFQLHQYESAIPYYEQALALCYDREKGDIFYRMGFCHMFRENWEDALENFRNALSSYKAHRDTSELQPRVAQIQNMIKGCEGYIMPDSTDLPSDSIQMPGDSIKMPVDSIHFSTDSVQQTKAKQLFDSIQIKLN